MPTLRQTSQTYNLIWQRSKHSLFIAGFTMSLLSLWPVWSFEATWPELHCRRVQWHQHRTPQHKSFVIWTIMLHCYGNDLYQSGILRIFIAAIENRKAGRPVKLVLLQRLMSVQHCWNTPLRCEWGTRKDRLCCSKINTSSYYLHWILRKLVQFFIRYERLWLYTAEHIIYIIWLKYSLLTQWNLFFYIWW